MSASVILGLRVLVRNKVARHLRRAARRIEVKDRRPHHEARASPLASARPRAAGNSAQPQAAQPDRRSFDLRLPRKDAHNGLPAHANVRHSLAITAPRQQHVPRLLERHGLAGFEPDSFACLLAILEQTPGRLLFDIGANIGLYALVTTALSNWHTVAFEPTPELAVTARALGKANGLLFAVEQLAVGDQVGTAPLYLSDSTDSSNSLTLDYRPSSASIDVKVVTLDKYCTDSGQWPDLLKVDTESTEPAVFRGARRLLEQHRPWIICEVLGPRTEDQLMELFEPLDYAWYQITQEERLVRRREIFGDRNFNFMNWLFAPEPPNDTFFESMAAWRESLSQCTARLQGV